MSWETRVFCSSEEEELTGEGIEERVDWYIDVGAEYGLKIRGWSGADSRILVELKSRSGADAETGSERWQKVISKSVRCSTVSSDFASLRSAVVDVLQRHGGASDVISHIPNPLTFLVRMAKRRICWSEHGYSAERTQISVSVVSAATTPSSVDFGHFRSASAESFSRPVQSSIVQSLLFQQKQTSHQHGDIVVMGYPGFIHRLLTH